MRKLLIIFNVLMLTSLCIGCSNVENRYEVIDLAGAVHNVEPCKLSTYASNIDYLPIGSEDSVLLGDIYYHKFLVDEENIFIVAPKMKCIYMFGRDGKLIRSIGQRGRAYGEYTAARSMMSDSGSDLLMVEGGNKTVIYSTTDGSCKGEYNFDELFDKSKDQLMVARDGRSQIISNVTIAKIVMKDKKFYLATGDQSTLDQALIIVGENGAIESSVEIRKTEVRNFFNNVLTSGIYEYDNKINLIHGLQDTIYQLEGERLIPRIAINYGNYQTLSTQKSRRRSNNSMQVAVGYQFIESAAMIAGTVFLPSSAVVYSNGSQYSNFVYDKASRKSVIVDYQEEFDMAGFINDIDGGMPFWPQQLRGNKMFSFVDAGTFIEMSKKCNSPKMKEVARKLTEESNPVLVEVTLK